MCYCVLNCDDLKLYCPSALLLARGRGWCNSGVRSGMATEEQDMEVDRQVPTSGANPIQARAVRMSVRPPARFSATSDLALYMAKEIRALCAAGQNSNGTESGRASVLIGG